MDTAICIQTDFTNFMFIFQYFFPCVLARGLLTSICPRKCRWFTWPWINPYKSVLTWMSLNSACSTMDWCWAGHMFFCGIRDAMQQYYEAARPLPYSERSCNHLGLILSLFLCSLVNWAIVLYNYRIIFCICFLNNNDDYYRNNLIT